MKEHGMYSFFTLPWYCKGVIIAYDVFRCLVLRKDVAKTQDAPLAVDTLFDTTMHVFVMQALLAMVLLAPSLCLSVSDRLQTNTFVSEMMLLLGVYALCISAMRSRMVSPEHVCFSLQFCSAYFFFCYFKASHRPKLLLGHGMVKLASLLAMCVFPVLYGPLLEDCMHLSPYVLVFVFSGELSGCVCTGVSWLLAGVECCVDALYGGVCDVLV